jgi:hypothetical protein
VKAEVSPPPPATATATATPTATPTKRSLAPLFVLVTLISVLIGAAGAYFVINR